MNSQESIQVLEEGENYSFHTDKIMFVTLDLKDGKQSYVTGYISVPEIDLYNDLITPDALKSMLRQIYEKNITIDYEHESWRDDNSILPVGKIVEAKVDGKGLWIKAILNRHSPKFKALWGSIKDGFINAFSIAFKPLKIIKKTIGNATIRLIEDLKLLNVALTGAPVNEGAVITDYGMKSVILKAINDFDGMEMKKKHSAKWEKLVRALRREGKVRSPEAVATATLGAESYKSFTHSDEKQLNCKGDNMEEKKVDESPKAEESAEEPKPEGKPAEEPKAEEKSAEPEKPEEPAKPEEPKEEAAEEKSLKKVVEDLKSKVEAQQKEQEKLQSDLKALKEKEVFKSPTPTKPEVKSEGTNMLSLIR